MYRETAEAGSKSASAVKPQTRGRGTGGHRLAAAFQAVEALPALAESQARLRRLTARPGSAADDIVDAIESDTALAITVMRAANNGAGPGRGTVTGIPQAVEVLTARGVESEVRDVRTYELFEDAQVWRGLPERFRRHAIATRCAVERVGELARLPGRDELALAALLHDVGKLVMLRLYDSYDALVADPSLLPERRVHLELRELGIDHAIVGGVLARRWGLPSRVASAIERHHAPDATGAAAAIRLADLIVHQTHGEAIDPEVVRAMGEALGLEEPRLGALFYEYPYARAPRRKSSEPCPLSGRELDALRGLADGRVYKEIAEEMGLSTSTVRTHLHNVYRKIGAMDRAQAVLIAHERGWI